MSEMLNHTLNQAKPLLMKTYMKNILTIAGMLFMLSFCGCKKDSETKKASDSIKIISVTPSESLEYGTEYTFKVDVSYELATIESGKLMIGVNSMDSFSYTLIDDSEVTVTKGTGVHTFYITTTVKSWGLIVYVNISEDSNSDSWRPLESDILKLKSKE